MTTLREFREGGRKLLNRETDTADFTFGLRHRVVNGTDVLTFWGELDAWADQELSPRVTTLLDQAGHQVVADLRKVTFLDAGGLRLLVRIRKRVTADRGTLWLVPGRPGNWRVLRLTRLDRAFTIPASAPYVDGRTGAGTGFR
ncbi:anti-sigma factor antagonist [Streptomyces alfalfae]|uniref:Anti-sigma factor antagonist n=1 Tax=Streptomyces alfalfae TaxID=1642299 RepID=A0A4V1QF20_9ACTN|nr:STAS domain-containing protein [Streptomyces alfalfae]AYA20223.1 anti-sigma factor antagonist [Streptomyces fradiae]QQC87746.1 STAS domain-containing protein [Streptomyces alfalfae]QUI30175.1 STAS domain-containing protein [Streptomyces alfalfae]RXX43713.1 anti-sigma factor antagonist [Streptomyces alfalfae]RZM93584.1 anti-sigma factor antagonist [Streptomyces alfalfae]